MFLAIASRVLFTKPAIFAHTIYPPVELFVVYGIYWLIGKELFKKKESQLSVVLLAILVNLFFYCHSLYAVNLYFDPYLAGKSVCGCSDCTNADLSVYLPK